ncbi:DUF2252 domain-containing protein [Acetobacter musti]|uniref:DUF2252 domain-containing protein n=1 Tax=Acetobacter musti TaxID=864732 RepID=A0ABX0JN45_9PROT|nr:DUF2252 domain-containing protein [Acetobacter musti]NHN84178.1 DUF2252 domain-containing protein [Acetobacter musti]
MQTQHSQASASLRPEAAPHLQTRKECHAAGVKLRKSVRRGCHADWTTPAGRASPVAILATQGLTRIPDLLSVRYARMKASPFAFLRGAAAVMAADLAHTPTTGLTVQACGDCHLANFGSYASPEGIPVFDINDFDETLRAPFEWDIRRLGTSLVLAGLEGGLSDKAARLLSRDMTLTYAKEMTRLAGLSPLEIWTDRVDLVAAIAQFEDRKVREAVQAQLARRLDSARNHFGLVADSGPAPSLRERPPFVMRLPAHEDTIRQAFSRYVATQPAERAVLLDRYRLRDVVFKVVGIGSVGTFCAIGLFATADGETLLLQIKEAQESVLAPFTGPSCFHNQGERVVTGQRITQAVSDSFLGWTRSDGPQTDKGNAAPDLSGQGRQFYVRRLKDTRLAAIGSDSAQQGLADYARLCGRTLARAHARSGDVATIAGYLGKGAAFADAISRFSAAYAKQTHRDWAVFTAALKDNQLPAPSGPA